MSELELRPLELEELKTRSSLGEECITVCFEGSADLEVREALQDLLDRLHAEAVRLHTRRVVVDFVKLEFMNSSCFKTFLGWINCVQALEPANQYRVSFIPNERLHWQKRSLHAMRCFAVNLISIDPR